MSGGLNYKPNKRKWIVAGVLSVISVIPAFYISVILHLLLTKAMSVQSLEMPGIGAGIALLRSSDQALKLFFICAAFLWLGIVMMVLSMSRASLQTGVNQIVPGVETPMVAGQNQHGSARWLSDAKKCRAFGLMKLSIKSKMICELLQAAATEKEQVEKWREVHRESEG